jgi:seryl-tRNA synthetase
LKCELSRVAGCTGDAPDGKGDADNVVVRTEGDLPGKDAPDVPPHWEIAEALGIFDPDRAAKLSGAMFSVLTGDGARLLRGLVNFGLDLHRDTYTEVIPPHFVRAATLTATGHLPKFAEDAYRCADDDLWAIPTGEVPLTALHADEILAADELPKRYMAHTACFRREAGSAGADTRGMQRLHEFHKVELVRICTPEQSEAEYAALLADAERTLQTLKLPYRVLDLCAGDLTFGSSRVYDLEVYSPGTGRWLEVSSVGLFTDFQARRAKIRFKAGKKGKPQIAHTMNASGLATPRVWAAVLEYGWNPDGSVTLPDVLHPYVGTGTLQPA